MGSGARPVRPSFAAESFGGVAVRHACESALPLRSCGGGAMRPICLAARGIDLLKCSGLSGISPLKLASISCIPTWNSVVCSTVIAKLVLWHHACDFGDLKSQFVQADGLEAPRSEWTNHLK